MFVEALETVRGGAEIGKDNVAPARNLQQVCSYGKLCSPPKRRRLAVNGVTRGQARQPQVQWWLVVKQQISVSPWPEQPEFFEPDVDSLLHEAADNFNNQVMAVWAWRVTM